MVESQTPKIRTWGNQRNNSKRVKSTIPELSIACLGTKQHSQSCRDREREVFEYCQSVMVLVLQAQPLSSLGLCLIGPQLHDHGPVVQLSSLFLGLIGPHMHDHGPVCRWFTI